MKKRKISIIIPVYNEEETIATVITTLLRLQIPGWEKEIVVVDDGSTDATAQRVKKLIKNTLHITLLQLVNNSGKGVAVVNGIRKAKGEYILVQDADLEYDPEDIPSLLLPITKHGKRVVYGTRLNRLPNLKRDERTVRFLFHYFGNKILSLLLSILYGHSVSDIETGYKVFPRSIITDTTFISRGFEFEPEITIKLIKAGYTIHEVAIRTNPRGYEKGKKLRTIPDGIKALRMILSQKL